MIQTHVSKKGDFGSNDTLIRTNYSFVNGVKTKNISFIIRLMSINTRPFLVISSDLHHVLL